MNVFDEFLIKSPEELEIENQLKNNIEELHASEVYASYIEKENTLYDKLHEIKSKKSRKLMTAFKNEANKIKKEEILNKHKVKNENNFSHIEKQLQDYLNTLNKNEKCAIFRIFSRLSNKFDIKEYENPVTTTEHIKQLQEILVQVCINYINENKLTDIEEVHFNADSLQSSAHYGEWVCQTDSYISIDGYQNDDECDHVTRKRIGEYY